MNIHRLVPVGLLAAAGATGLVGYATGTDGSKQAEIGTALFTSSILGGILIAVERSLSRQSEAATRAVELSSAPPPSADNDDAAVERTGAPTGTYEVKFIEWSRDHSRVDATQIRLRLFKDGEYLQFVVALVSGIDLRVAVHSAGGPTLGQFQRACVLQAIDRIQIALERGEIPLDEPTRAFEVTLDGRAAADGARLLPDQMYEEDEIVRSWVAVDA